MNTGRAASEGSYWRRRDGPRCTEMVRCKGGLWQQLLHFRISISSPDLFIVPHIHTFNHLLGPLLQDLPTGISHFPLPPSPVSPWLQRSASPSTSTQNKLSTSHLWLATWSLCLIEPTSESSKILSMVSPLTQVMILSLYLSTGICFLSPFPAASLFHSPNTLYVPTHIHVFIMFPAHDKVQSLHMCFLLPYLSFSMFPVWLTATHVKHHFLCHIFPDLPGRQTSLRLCSCITNNYRKIITYILG